MILKIINSSINAVTQHGDTARENMG